MRLRPVIVTPVAVSLLTILTGCHLSRTPSPALSIAAVAVSAGGLLGATCSFQWVRNAAVLGSVRGKEDGYRDTIKAVYGILPDMKDVFSFPKLKFTRRSS
jgi:hypothetical protein